MDIKLEAPKPEPRSYEICRLCLSTERATRGVRNVSYAYGLMTDWAPQSDVSVCWECEATLRRILRFKLQAMRALQLLEDPQGEISMDDLNCVTTLGRSAKSTYDATFVYDVDCFQFEHTSDKILSGFKGADRLSTEIPNGFESDPETWADTALPGEFKETLLENGVDASDFDATLVPKVSKKKKKNKFKIDEMTDKWEMFEATGEELSSHRERWSVKIKKYPFKCSSCIVGYKVEEKLHLHNKRYHTDAVGGHVCDVCLCRFVTKEALSQHRDAHNTLYRCKYPGCGFVHRLSVSISNHFTIHEPRKKKYWSKSKFEKSKYTYPIGVPYECDYCGKTFKIRRQIAVHVKRHMRLAMCEICGKKFGTLVQMRTHTLAHLDPSHRPYGCDVCQKRFIDKYKLLVHSRQHTGERPYKCESCETSYVCKEELTRHTKLRHSIPGTSVRKFCQPRTKSYFINKRHTQGETQKQLKLKKDYEIKKEGDDIYECNVCGKRLATFQKLQAHFAVHDNSKRLDCNECNRIFKYNSQLQFHIKTVHKGEKPHQCTICGARFATKPVLSVHLNSHSNEKPFKCDECGLTFKYNSGLWTHRLLHKGEKPHQCTVCGSRFTLKGNLTGHMKTHTNDKPFECNVCGRKFPWKRNLRNHFKTHLKEQRLVEGQTPAV